MRRAALVLVAATLVATLMPLGSMAQAAPRTRPFGPLIEDYAPYQGQTRCSPTAKPGMVSFKNLLLRTYGQRWIGIGRACHIGGRSEHKEGRAIDWSMNAARRADRLKVSDLMRWLFATDRYGTPHANARRLGIMYVIWNRRWWTTWNRGWETYCIQRRRGCVSPRDGGINHPHTDHVHISFSWASARKRMSFFRRARSFVTGMAADPDGSGYWLAGGDGSVHRFRAPGLGSRAGTFSPHHFVAVASTPSGSGYWLLLRNGRVHRFGDAPYLGRPPTTRVVDIEPTPSGKGYWILGRDGRMFTFGDAVNHGVSQGRMVGMAVTPSGGGYWVFGRDGQVHAFGDAAHHGDLGGRNIRVPIVDGAARGGDGYWLVHRNGYVRAYGSAALYGHASRVSGFGAASRIVPTTTSRGYWIAGRYGTVAGFGDAPVLGSLS